MVSPAYVAVTEYVPGASAADAVHNAEPLDAVAEHKVEPPAANVTVPVAAPGRPPANRLTPCPKLVVLGMAEAMKDVAALATVKLVDAVDPR